jgi:4-hydroxy-4-methyl-2-oxoglutarate aldolase
VDGPIRDVDDLSCDTRVYSTLVSPYAGTVQHPGEGLDATPIICGNVVVNPGDIIFGDTDGVVVGSAESFSLCLHEAENIMSVEHQLMEVRARVVHSFSPFTIRTSAYDVAAV